MFSIENLAWRDDKVRMDEFDAYGLSPEQKGPLGGRIMWFPPYDLTFNEDVSVNWNPNQFIGRGEKVYTYTDTERSGNLSFTLLIDHPAILDYWTGHERNGMKNKGVHLDPGNSGGIDNKNNQENTLLRFFAGCDILTAKPQDYRIRSEKPEITPEPQEPKEPAPKEPDEVKEKVKKKICAIVYYPNNYSGVDDNGGIGSDDEGKVNPIYYLMNGVGAQKEIVYRSASKNYETIDLGTNITSDDGVGYEMSTNAVDGGISLITWDRIKDETYYGVVNKEDPPQFKKNNGVNEYILNATTYGGKNIVLGKQIGKSASKGTDTTSIASKWKQKRWFYRVDKAYQEQVFSRPQSYIDGNSYGLNAQGFGKVRQHSNVIKNFGLEEDSDIYKLVSFADVFVAFEGEENNVVSSKATEANVKLVKDVFENKEKYSNIKISFNGHASFQGYSSSNNTLATNRALTLRRWLSSFKETDGAEFGEPKVINQPREVKKDTGELDDELVKIWRSASIVIEYEEENVTNAATAESPRAISGDSGNTIYQQDRVEIKNKETSSSYIDFISNLGSVQGTNGKTLAETAWETMGEINGKNYTDPNNWENYDDSFLHRDDFKQSVVKRYDNEGEFFEALTEESPFLHHLISEKIRYFDPAYHSISPEGFNARLTFLHQCTRQGSTVESSSFEQESTAYNLAFGRPPVCVLRLGDFYYTKIIITSLNIQYENAQWDMNPEGIGMMPMFAKVTINFKFLGGSDLAGPIARLQNAVSFNYYANTSVYDNRAEKVEYEPNGSGKEIKFKGFHYPNIYVGDRLNQGMIGKKKEDGTIYAEDF
jgi:outer membrane protein OmpA-like peptidoglycan-associated protein